MIERMRAARSYMVVGLCIAAACSLEPSFREPVPPIADVWPIPATTPAGKEAVAADIGWREFFADKRLQTLIAQALENNRDLRIAVLNVERARAMYRIQRAQQLPSVSASGVYTKQNIPSALSDGVPPSTYQSYEVSLGMAAFELDLFGRVNSLSRAALEQYSAQEEHGAVPS